MRSLVLTFTLSREEFIAIWRSLQLRRRRALLSPAAGLVILVIATAFGSAAGIAAGAFVAIWTPWCLFSYGPRRAWARLPVLHHSQTITLSASGVTEELLNVTASFDWDHWSDVIHVTDAWILRSSGGYTFIPQRAIATPEDEATLRELVASRLNDRRFLKF
jgi:hypothetical protein